MIMAGLSLMPASASATVAEELSIEELASEAILVVRARVGARYVAPDRGPQGQIYTRTELTVLDYLKGGSPTPQGLAEARAECARMVGELQERVAPKTLNA